MHPKVYKQLTDAKNHVQFKTDQLAAGCQKLGNIGIEKYEQIIRKMKKEQSLAAKQIQTEQLKVQFLKEIIEVMESQNIQSITLNEFQHFIQLKMRAILSICKDLEKEFHHDDVAVLMAFPKPPPSCVSVLGLAYILFQG